MASQKLTVSLPKVDATGFEPATSASRTQRSTKLSHASLCINEDVSNRAHLYYHIFLRLSSKILIFLQLFLKSLKSLSQMRCCAEGNPPLTHHTADHRILPFGIGVVAHRQIQPVVFLNHALAVAECLKPSSAVITAHSTCTDTAKTHLGGRQMHDCIVDARRQRTRAQKASAPSICPW